jgi:DNA-binding response OmpR family regulator
MRAGKMFNLPWLRYRHLIALLARGIKSNIFLLVSSIILQNVAKNNKIVFPNKNQTRCLTNVTFNIIIVLQNIKIGEFFMFSLLFIDDDNNLTRQIERYFGQNYNIEIAENLAEADKILKRFTPDIAVCDVILPDGNGLDYIRSGAIPSPVIILSQLGDDKTVIAGLSCCIDYCVKPISMSVLEKRILMRLGYCDSVIKVGKLTIDHAQKQVKYCGREIELTSSEFNILHFLVTHPKQLFSADEIYEPIWGMESLHSSAVRYHISNLRKKLKEAAPDKEFIHTNFGKGYSFDG